MLDILSKEMDFHNPHIGQVSKSCLEAGTCDYGIYPLENRFYIDQVPLDLFQYGKASLNPKGAGEKRLLQLSPPFVKSLS